MIDHQFVQKMPFIVKPYNIAHYEDGVVSILDRRIYPFETRFEECKTYEDVAVAIEKMVTQSLGPAYAAGYGMVQAGRACKDYGIEDIRSYMNLAGVRMINTRPTNHEIRLTVEESLKAVDQALAKDQTDMEQVLLTFMDDMIDKRHAVSLKLGGFGASVVKSGDAILTHCWPETTLVYTLLTALEQGKDIRAYCTETRPYLQGARLTASAISDMGIDTTVITDNMPASLMSQGKINIFFAGSDRTTMDGHIINKVGTLQLAICAKHFGIPFYPFAYGPDKQSPGPETVKIEERDPEEVLHCRGLRTAAPGVSGYYPAFDITPPDFVTGIITDKGIFPPDKITEYFK